jgi:hypothetical protein
VLKWNRIKITSFLKINFCWDRLILWQTWFLWFIWSSYQLVWYFLRLTFISYFLIMRHFLPTRHSHFLLQLPNSEEVLNEQNRPLQWRWELGSFGTTSSYFKSFSNKHTSLQSYISSFSPRSKTLPALLL